jgi:predicted aspartyl protease
MLDVSFLVDTGADRSLLNPPDARELGLESAELAPEIEIGGVTESGRHHVELASISFLTGQRLYVYRLPLLVADPSRVDVNLLPSILGRDILNRWDMSYRPSRGSLTFDIVTADEILHVT